IIAPAIKEYCLDSTTNGTLAGNFSKHGTSVPVICTVISGLKSRAPTTPNYNLFVTTNTDNTSIFNCLIIKSRLQAVKTALAGVFAPEIALSSSPTRFMFRRSMNKNTKSFFFTGVSVRNVVEHRA
ncbi:MAG: hypothetical protein IKA23_07570, partial [Akkermansia sp.]|nr:hypothetical protein [Akkermansia sp.]